MHPRPKPPLCAVAAIPFVQSYPTCCLISTNHSYRRSPHRLPINTTAQFQNAFPGLPNPAVHQSAQPPTTHTHTDRLATPPCSLLLAVTHPCLAPCLSVCSPACLPVSLPSPSPSPPRHPTPPTPLCLRKAPRRCTPLPTLPCRRPSRPLARPRAAFRPPPPVTCPT